MENEVTSKTNKVLFLLFIGVLMGALDISIIGPALHSIQSEFIVNDRILPWIFSIYVLFNLIGVSILSKYSDIYGRRNSYIISIAIFALGSLIISISWNYEIVLIGRAIQGFGAGGIFPVATAIIGDTIPLEKRGTALGLIGSVFGIAFIIGPIIAGFLLLINWHWLFIINLPIAIILIIWAYKILPANKIIIKKDFDYIGMILIIVFLTLFTISINRLDTKHIFSSLKSFNIILLFVITFLLIFIFRYFEKNHSNPIIKIKHFQSKQVKIVSIIAICTGIIETSLVFIPNFAIELFNYTSSKASFMLMPLVIAMAIASPASGKLLDKIGSKIIIHFGAIFSTIGFFILSINCLSQLLFIIAEILIGIGLSMLLGASLRYILLNEVPANERTSIQGVLTIFLSVGMLIGSAAAGSIISSFGGGKDAHSKLYLYIAIISAMIILYSIFLKNKAKEQIH